MSEHFDRFKRQMSLPNFGLEGQRKLAAARVLIVGVGGLGSPAALYLAAAGVGTLGLADFDKVALHNLHRQILHGDSDVDSPKLESAARRLLGLNKGLSLELHSEGLHPENALELADSYDILLEGSDNFPSRYLLNDAAVLAAKPLVYSGLFQYEAQVSLLHPPESPCYRCLFPSPPAKAQNCSDFGVLGPLCGIAGSFQALETLKYLLNLDTQLKGKILRIDALAGTTTTIAIKPDPACKICGPKASIDDINPLIYYNKMQKNSPKPDFWHASCSASNSKTTPPHHITPSELKTLLKKKTPPTLLDVREPHERDQGHLQNDRNIPLQKLPEALQHLNKNAEHIVYCQHGQRSQRAVALLHKKGFKAQGISGGFAALDPSDAP